MRDREMMRKREREGERGREERGREERGGGEKLVRVRLATYLEIN